MHARNIIHRDLKLDNLLITENLRVKVCDFGFSRLLLPAEGVLEDSTLKTQKGSRGRRLTHVGTDGYMAPELMLCLDEYDASVDVFSFGIILLALVTMQLPESGMDTENAASTTNGLFERIVPGFGLNSDKMEAAVDAAIPARSILLDLIRRSVSDEPKQRPSLKDILSVLKKVELAVITELQACTLTMLQNDPSLHLPVIGASTYSLTSNAHSLASNSASAMGSLADLPAVTSVEETTTYTRSMSELSTAVASPTTPMREVASNLPSNNSLAPTQHRFSIVFKVGLHSHLTCDHCSKNIRGLLHKYLTCDDCGTLCHRKCARLLAPHCKSRTAVAASKEEITVLSISATNTETIKSASMFSH